MRVYVKRSVRAKGHWRNLGGRVRLTTGQERATSRRKRSSYRRRVGITSVSMHSSERVVSANRALKRTKVLEPDGSKQGQIKVKTGNRSSARGRAMSKTRAGMRKARR